MGWTVRVETERATANITEKIRRRKHYMSRLIYYLCCYKKLILAVIPLIALVLAFAVRHRKNSKKALEIS